NCLIFAAFPCDSLKCKLRPFYRPDLSISVASHRSLALADLPIGTANGPLGTGPNVLHSRLRSVARRPQMRVQLTDRFCASAKSTTAPQTDYFDASVPGLALRVTDQGTKAWSLLHGTPRRRVTLGRYPALSLAAARARAIEVKDGRSAGTVAALTEI